MANPPLIVHIIYRLSIGGLENGLINLINEIPTDRYRNIIICLKDSTDFIKRIKVKGVEIYCLHRNDGQDFGMLFKLFRLLSNIRPDIVHTRNLSTLECQLPAYLAGVTRRIHGEHGWDIYDLNGTNIRYQLLRKFIRPFIHRYIPLSSQLKQYLCDKIGVPVNLIRQIPNGVNTKIFYPAISNKSLQADNPFSEIDNLVLIGTVGRMHGVKDQMTLVYAFLTFLDIKPEAKSVARLVLVGDGPLRQQAIDILTLAGVDNLAWLPGERDDVYVILRTLDIFVLPSTAEGMSNVILEAMATGLPVIATTVGGNPDLVVDGESGILVEPGNPKMIAEALAYYYDNPHLMKIHGLFGLSKIQQEFSLEVMVNRYLAVYDELMNLNDHIHII